MEPTLAPDSPMSFQHVHATEEKYLPLACSFGRGTVNFQPLCNSKYLGFRVRKFQLLCWQRKYMPGKRPQGSMLSMFLWASGWFPWLPIHWHSGWFATTVMQGPHYSPEHCLVNGACFKWLQNVSFNEPWNGIHVPHGTR